MSGRQATMFRVSVVRVVSVIWAIAMPALAFAQAQAANGNIEGTVKDGSGAVLPGMTVTVTNTDTGRLRNHLNFRRLVVSSCGRVLARSASWGRGATRAAGI